MADPVVRTTAGRVRGRAENGVAAWRGIPYAAPPWGPLRFGEPVAHDSWDGTRDATSLGPTVPKPPYRPPFNRILDDPVIEGEDCLNLNVWSPDPGTRGLPVMVWIHGGAFRNGSNAIPTYSGDRFARDGVVCVTVNYRLGCEGFLHIEDAPANRGILDQVAALRWVQDNITGFGGDPGRVTVFGESAGGMSVTTLMAMPMAAGLFQRAIAQSGAGHHALPPATARMVTEELAGRLEVKPTRDGFASVSPNALVEAQHQLSLDIALDRDPARWKEVSSNMMALEPVIDGEVLPQLPIDAVRDGASAGVDLLVGSTRDEYRFFTVPTGVYDAVSDEEVTRIATRLGLDPAGIDLYREPADPPGEVMCQLMTDWFFRIPAIRLAEAVGGKAYMYEFTWPTPALDGRLGSCHAIELPFVFDTLDEGGGFTFHGPDAPRELAAQMHASWVAFAKSGDPGWQPYTDPSRATRIFGPGDGVISDPRRERRLLWEGCR